MTRLDALILSTPLIAVMVVLCAVLLFQRRGRNRRRRGVLGRPWDDPRDVSGKYMETLRNNRRFG